MTLILLETSLVSFHKSHIDSLYNVGLLGSKESAIVTMVPPHTVAMIVFLKINSLSDPNYRTEETVQSQQNLNRPYSPSSVAGE